MNTPNARATTLSVCAIRKISPRRPYNDQKGLNGTLGVAEPSRNRTLDVPTSHQGTPTRNLLQKPVLTLAIKFQDNRKAQRERLIKVIRTLGATPAREKSLAEYAKVLEVDKLKSPSDVLNFAHRVSPAANRDPRNTTPRTCNCKTRPRGFPPHHVGAHATDSAYACTLSQSQHLGVTLF
jgi:hypothetical protein